MKLLQFSFRNICNFTFREICDEFQKLFTICHFCTNWYSNLSSCSTTLRPAKIGVQRVEKSRPQREPCLKTYGFYTYYFICSQIVSSSIQFETCVKLFVISSLMIFPIQLLTAQYIKKRCRHFLFSYYKNGKCSNN